MADPSSSDEIGQRVWRFLRLLVTGRADEASLREQIEEAIDEREGEAENADDLSAAERLMLRNLLHFGECQVDDVAVPRADMVAFEASGTTAGLNAAILNVRRGGTVVQIGNLSGGLQPVAANAIMAREIDLKGSFRFGREFEAAVRLIGEKKIDVLSIVTAERPLTAAPDGIRLALDKSQSVKVVLTA